MYWRSVEDLYKVRSKRVIENTNWRRAYWTDDIKLVSIGNLVRELVLSILRTGERNLRSFYNIKIKNYVQVIFIKAYYINMR